MSHSGLPSTTPRLSEAILRRAMASTASPCSPISARISRPCRSATAKFGISTSPSSRIRAIDSRARKRIRASLSFIVVFSECYPIGLTFERSDPPRYKLKIAVRGPASKLQRESFLLGQAIANHPAQTSDAEPRIEPRLLLRHPVGFVVDFRFSLEIRGH